MKNSTLLLLLFSLCFIYPATAQHKTVVYGNLGTSNVNISISNSPIGTSTDANGQYALTLYNQTKTINLHYSCIGYQDTVVSLSPRQLQRDSINISFKMRKQNYNLQEVTVTDTHKFQGESYYFMDFEVFDNTICILAACPNKTCAVLSWPMKTFVDTIPSRYQHISNPNKCCVTAWATASSLPKTVFTKSIYSSHTMSSLPKESSFSGQ